MVLENGTILSGRYQIEEKIAAGGMSVVYIALDLKINRYVAVKVLKEEFTNDEEFIKKFRTEAYAAGGIQHPNIISIYDVGNDNDIYYIVMEYIDGFTLKELIKNNAPFTNEEMISIAIQIADALYAAHSNNIIHRDIKPQNILMTRDGTVKVGDFGIARVASSSTLKNDSVGSVHYFSPEQARGVYVDYKSDIYSLGIVMYEMMTGRLPFEGDNTVQLAMKHMQEPLPDMKQFNPDVSPSVEKIVSKCTQKVSMNRYTDAKELSDDLKLALNDPDGDFVSESNVSPTVIITDKERDEINSKINDNRNMKYDADFREELTPKINKGNKANRGKNSNAQNNNDDKKVVFAAVATALAIIAVITALMMNYFHILKGEDGMPQFVGKTWTEAENIAASHEIYIKKTEEQYSDEYEKDIVISQSIDEGEDYSRGDTIEVVVSLGSEKIEIPDVVGLDSVEAYEMFTGIDVEIKTEYVFDDKTEVGKISKQSPSGGELAEPQSTVIFYISKGEADTVVTVPNVATLTQEEAEKMLQDSGLVVGTVVTSTSPTLEAGKVIKQGVAAGSQVNKGYVVNLIVSSGIETTEAPTSEETTSTEATTKREINIDANTTVATEAPVSDSSAQKTEQLKINPNIAEGKESVEIKIIEKTDSNTTKEIYSKTATPDDFPMTISVTGNKPTEYELYVDGQYIGSETKTFE